MGHLIDSLTAGVSKAPVTSGILYDRALPLAMLHSFNQQQADTTSNRHLRQGYLELFVASYNQGAFRYTPGQLRQRTQAIVARDTVPLAVLDYQFHHFNPQAVRDGLLTANNGLVYDVAQPSRSPFVLRGLTLASPLVDTARQRTVVFKLGTQFCLGNRTQQVTRVQVDFNDLGPNLYFNTGQSVRVTYPTDGPKVLWFIVHFSDGSSANVRASMFVKQQPPNRSIPVTMAGLAEVEAAIPFENYDASNSLYGKGDVLAVLHHPTTQAEHAATQTFTLRNPVIVLDGFDPQDS